MNNLTALVNSYERQHLTRRFPRDLRIGRTYDVDVRIQEGDKYRVQTYRGTLIREHRAGNRSTVTLRKLSRGVGVERVFPVVSPDIQAVRPVVAIRRRRRGRASEGPGRR